MKTFKNSNHFNPILYSTRIIIAFIFCITLFSCEGEDGAIGPEGPRGEQGESGEQGDPGTANVIYSEWINTGFANDINNINTAFKFDVPEINVDILNSGTILVYGRSFNTNDGARVYQLPFTAGVGSTRISYLYSASSGEIEIRINSAEIIGTNDFLLQYRYIIIPGGQAAKSSLDYTKMSYSEIENLFNIPKK